MGDEGIDIFLMTGTPKEVLGAYTGLTGKALCRRCGALGCGCPITYKSEAEAREVAAALKTHRIPCDVIHLDTGWFEGGLALQLQVFAQPLRRSEKDDRGSQPRRVSRLPLADPVFHAEKTSCFPSLSPRGLAVKMQTDSFRPTTLCWIFKSGYGRMVCGKARRPVRAGRFRNQGGFRRGRAADRRLCLGGLRLYGAQPLSAALQ